jgi:HD-GYP domain-containing protein (c-di-GMP phosphodiesterase class II)
MFTVDELARLEAVADLAAQAIVNVRRMASLIASGLGREPAYDLMLEGWADALDERDREPRGHTRRIAAMTARMASAMGMTGEALVHLRRGALLHDIGKIGVPDRILQKPGALTPEEWEVVRRHPQYACEVLSPLEFLAPALDIPYSHHEKWDGTGYPLGLEREAIPLPARIFAVADVYDALSSDRPYRKGWKEDAILDYICSLVGTHFDPEVVKVFLSGVLPSLSTER